MYLCFFVQFVGLSGPRFVHNKRPPYVLLRMGGREGNRLSPWESSVWKMNTPLGIIFVGTHVTGIPMFGRVDIHLHNYNLVDEPQPEFPV